MIGLDTNILIRYFVRDDPAQAAVSQELIDKRLAAEGPGYVSLVVTAELLWVLRKVYSRPTADLVLVLEGMLSADTLLLQNEDEVFRAMMVLKSGQGSFVDALIGGLNAWAGCATTLTFDRKAARLPNFTLA